VLHPHCPPTSHGLPERSEGSALSSFNLELSTACPERGRANLPSLSPFPVYPELRRATLTRNPHSCRKTPPVSPSFATLADGPQLAENSTTLSPVPATLTDTVKHKSFACHSYRKHPGWGSHPSSQVLSFRNLTTRHSLLVSPEASRSATISFRIRTSPKRACNSPRIRTSKTQDLKPFRISTYKKTGGGGPNRW
jgi:hypothetical protein